MSASEYENPNLRENQRRLTAAGDGACAPEQEVARSSRAGPTLETPSPLRLRSGWGRCFCAFGGMVRGTPLYPRSPSRAG
jgi:hypothetical protein